MFHRFLKWLGTRLFRKEPATEDSFRQTGVRVRPPAARRAPQKPEVVRFKPQVNGKIADGGPGKNVLVRNKLVREESGTHDTLKIMDASLLEAEEEAGFDPYNTGRFDRGRSWETRARK